MFVVDASGSMHAAKRMKAVKGAVLSLLRDAYRQRDHVGLVAFRGSGAELLLEATRSVELAGRKLRAMPTGGTTPLAAGLLEGADAIRVAMRKRNGLVPAMIVITDGKANACRDPDGDPWLESRAAARHIAAAGVQSLVIDTEQGFVRLGFARLLADDLRARYCRLEELEAGAIERAVRGMRRT
ncbi:vWA domain-containing protein [Paenibacillus sp. GYB003]|uniref:vWA domain-containing protein n=1 Tax=Paenibacillus sp. GYB003 TaxID=2994392 RepID=UPI002F968099